MRKSSETGEQNYPDQKNPDVFDIVAALNDVQAQVSWVDHQTEIQLAFIMPQFKSAADQGNARFQSMYGLCLVKGPNIAVNLELAAHYVKLSADQGNASGQFYYGFCLENGLGVDIDLKFAAHYYKLSGDQGDACGQFHYGLCLQNACGVDAGIELAAHYYKLSADQGYAPGQFNYGLRLAEGRGANTDQGLAVEYFKLSADQGDAYAQCEYGLCLANGRGVSADIKLAAHYYKLSADQGNARGQCRYAECFDKGIGIERDFEQAMHYYHLSAGNRNSEAQCACGLYYLDRDIPDLSTAIKYLGLSAAGGDGRGQLHFAHLLDEGIGMDPNHILAAQYYERSSGSFSSACACYGWCLQVGCGVPVNFTESAEFFQRSADGNNADGANSLGVCLDVGRGLERNVERSMFYFGRAASQHHRSGMNNFGRCLEYGQSIAIDPHRSAKYYRLSAELGNSDAANNFGICLERGFGVKTNLDLAADYYRESAEAGHVDGSNNFGFCLEHGRGVRQNIGLAADYYKYAADCGHSEAGQNYRRCLRLLGRWSVPDRSSVVSEEKPSFEERHIDASDCMKSSLGMFAKTKQLVVSKESFEMRGEIGKGSLSVVRLAEYREEKVKRAVKTLQIQKNIRYLERENSIHSRLNHPLIVGFESYIPATSNREAQIITEFVPNGSLADHLESSENRSGIVESGGTRIAKIVSGIVLGMRYLHSCGIIHRDLKPGNILVDWDWIVRIGDLSHGVVVDDGPDEFIFGDKLSLDAHYTAPECFANSPTLKSDVFSFSLILYELLSGKPGFSRDSEQREVMKKIDLCEERPLIPDFFHDDVKSLIQDCWAQDPEDRPSFVEILFRLDRMDFQITNNVKSEKVRRFVKAVKAREKVLGIDMKDLD
jgi:TPR repeat protein/tRNA A-37 threonylcarbamoyl transferase component Bud32